ncbi:MAG TPA: recombinase family protein [Candidatus Udaeobacter sp.]|nr:recombinase family protein [Candidatus Udaeobacter sp.]
MRLVGYVRVSGLGQATDGFGIQVQQAAIRAWAKSNGHRLVRIERDDISGATDYEDRPGLSAALLAVAEGDADGLLVPRLDRLARALTVQEATLAYAWRSGGRVFTADSGEVMQDDPDDPMRTALRQVVGVFAELDRRMTVKRMRDGRKAKAASGRHSVGQYPYGTRATGKGRDKDAAEQAVVARILALRDAGESYRAIVAVLTAEGHRPRRADRWSAMSVRNVVRRAAGA